MLGRCLQKHGTPANRAGRVGFMSRWSEAIARACRVSPCLRTAHGDRWFWFLVRVTQRCVKSCCPCATSSGQSDTRGVGGV